MEEEEGEEQGVRVKERSFFLDKFLFFYFAKIMFFELHGGETIVGRLGRQDKTG